MLLTGYHRFFQWSYTDLRTEHSLNWYSAACWIGSKSDWKWKSVYWFWWVGHRSVPGSVITVIEFVNEAGSIYFPLFLRLPFCLIDWLCLPKLQVLRSFLVVLGPSRLFGEPSRAELFSGKASRAELFAFKTEPNRAFGFPKLSYFWLFSVEFFKEYNFLEEKTHFYWCLQDYTLRNWKKCSKSAHFLFLKVTRFFNW